ncbi:hypothetical protein NQ318_017433 [Aromia moschata]|uniref:Uncharacterized protein n=1 Tax=Aromia moschata TaxID=1265417 RepID=A0AAV8Z3P7_9CUCU|nr:hypothetical protein NQ318_017433 [Aromia moschata]
MVALRIPLNQAPTFDFLHQSIKNVFKREKLRPYKLQFVHELNANDFDRRAEFFEGMMERCNNNNNLARYYKYCLLLNDIIIAVTGQVRTLIGSKKRIPKIPKKLIFGQALLDDVLLDLSS